jgi:hypothetical protein
VAELTEVPITGTDRELAVIMRVRPEDMRAARVILPVLEREFGQETATFMDDVALQAVDHLGCTWQGAINTLLPLVRRHRPAEAEGVPHA